MRYLFLSMWLLDTCDIDLNGFLPDAPPSLEVLSPKKSMGRIQDIPGSIATSMAGEGRLHGVLKEVVITWGTESQQDSWDQDMYTFFNFEKSHSSWVRGHLTFPSFWADISSKAWFLPDVMSKNKNKVQGRGKEVSTWWVRSYLSGINIAVRKCHWCIILIHDFAAQATYNSWINVMAEWHLFC